ncbi:tyrosine-type recombinase/integrase [Pseudoxanthomonas sp. JBR18]|uniref:tyrosine-type recombinase/integrase n=1 Tax=Pseudoxanthomonas sp. JBR18 TaxID=2969308 RepID=UPI0023061050|nr:tyrosine-type recombinase/integrase [Pseudoxanthomonas sp. JBR18]WCE03158.1 tyrosine-type recombinase/integrase [Pseudoxanthomonas sp. JBR18]
MARFDIDKATVRNKLEPRREPYWGAPVETGLYVGFRRLEMGGNWIARYRTEEGQRYQALGVMTAQNDYEAARREARRWMKRVQAGMGATEIHTVAQACAEYVSSLELSKRPEAADAARQSMRRTVYADPMGAMKLDKLREKHLQEWMQRLETGTFVPEAVKGGRKTAPMKPATIRRTLASLKAALNLAVRKRHIAAERAIEWQAVGVSKAAETRRDLYLTREQRRALRDAATGSLRDLIECVALTGCRPGDPAVALRKDYDHRSGSVTFKTKEHPRTIPLSAPARELLDRLAKGKLPLAHLFTDDEGSAWTSRRWHEPMKAAVEAAGLPPQTVLYTLRHCWITDAIVSGMDLLTVARLVGTSVAMIEKNYGHLVDAAARDRLAQVSFI